MLVVWRKSLGPVVDGREAGCNERSLGPSIDAGWGEKWWRVVYRIWKRKMMDLVRDRGGLNGRNGLGESRLLGSVISWLIQPLLNREFVAWQWVVGDGVFRMKIEVMLLVSWSFAWLSEVGISSKESTRIHVVRSSGLRMYLRLQHLSSSGEDGGVDLDSPACQKPLCLCCFDSPKYRPFVCHSKCWSKYDRGLSEVESCTPIPWAFINILFPAGIQILRLWVRRSSNCCAGSLCWRSYPSRALKFMHCQERYRDSCMFVLWIWKLSPVLECCRRSIGW